MSLGRSIWAVLFDIFLSLVADLIGSGRKKNREKTQRLFYSGGLIALKWRKDLH
jgi:hypothetical protein